MRGVCGGVLLVLLLMLLRDLLRVLLLRVLLLRVLLLRVLLLRMLLLHVLLLRVLLLRVLLLLHVLLLRMLRVRGVRRRFGWLLVWHCFCRRGRCCCGLGRVRRVLQMVGLERAELHVQEHGRALRAARHLHRRRRDL